MKHNRITAIILALCLLSGTAACGEKQTEQLSSDDIELIEPVNTASNTEQVVYRNLYDYKVIPGFVYPDMHEYAFTLDARFLEYLVLPGDRVRKGTPLIKADEESLMDEIEQLQKSMEQAKETYLEQQESLDEELEDLYEQIDDLKKQHDDWEEELNKMPFKWDEDAPDWIKSILGFFFDAMWKIDYQIEAIQLKVDQNRMKAAQITQLYELDTAYDVQKLEDLQKRKDRYTVYSSVDGVVVSVGEMREGDHITEGETMIAVAGSQQKFIRCEYIKQSEVDKCEDLYAVIDGVRYEVTYQPYTTGEYNKLLDKNGTVYSSFILNDPQNQIKNGDYAVIVEIISDTGPVLTVPKGALHRDELGYFVYCVSDGESVPVHVKVGKSDGVYSQVLSGLEGGEVILLTDSNWYGSESVTVKRGATSVEFTRDGRVDYPSVSVITNPVENGTTYLTEMKAERFSNVRKGDVIATIRVVGDDVGLYEKLTELRRMNERYNEVEVERNLKILEYNKKFLNRYWEEDEEESPAEREERQAAEKEISNLAKELEKRRKAIDEFALEIQKIQADYATTVIRAEESGIIYWAKDFDRNNILAPDEVIAYVAETNRALFAVSDEKHQLVFGSTVTVEYKNEEGQTLSSEGTVVTASNAAISKSLVSDTTYIQFPKEVIRDIMQMAQSGRYYTQAVVSAQTRQMDGVLLVPRKAVHVINTKPYVYIKKEDGSIVAQSFIPGGSNNEYYWVIAGLEEGTILCSE